MVTTTLNEIQRAMIVSRIADIQTEYPGLILTEIPSIVTDLDISYIESELGLSLPKDYVWFLKTFGEISVDSDEYGFPLHVDGVKSMSGQKVYSVLEKTQSFKNDFDDETVAECEYDLDKIISIDTSEEDFQTLLSLKSGCLLSIEYYWEVDSESDFGLYLFESVSDIYSDLFGTSL